MSDENPYAPPEARLDGARGDAPLTPLERSLLRSYRAWHDRPPTLLALIGKNWKAYLFLVGMGVTAFVAGLSIQRAEFGYWVLGLATGLLGRDLGIFRRLLKLWPVLEEIINWRRVDQLLED